MNPGRSCVQCHAETNDPAQAPFYAFAGTVMRAEHEADDCRGVASITVIVTGADGSEVEMQGNSAGNFWLAPEIQVLMPYTARIVDSAGNERVQQNPVDNGDCASCHTQAGTNGAAGRLIPPVAG
jgi:cytochrome c553